MRLLNRTAGRLSRHRRGPLAGLAVLLLGLLISGSLYTVLSPAQADSQPSETEQVAPELGLRADVDRVEDRVEQLRDHGREVLYVTERAVFQLTEQGLELIEIAPGIDVRTQIIERIPFPVVVRQPKLMHARLYNPKPMGLAQLLGADVIDGGSGQGLLDTGIDPIEGSQLVPGTEGDFGVLEGHAGSVPDLCNELQGGLGHLVE